MKSYIQVYLNDENSRKIIECDIQTSDGYPSFIIPYGKNDVFNYFEDMNGETLMYHWTDKTHIFLCYYDEEFAKLKDHFNAIRKLKMKNL